MIKILFVCHGNICRSPMAEFLLKDMVKKAGISNHFRIASAATSTDAIGCEVHPGTKERLALDGISVGWKIAVQLKKEDYTEYDYLIGMDRWNIKDMQKLLGGDPDKKIHKLLEFAGSSRDVADPWYTGDFEAAYDDIKRGCECLLRSVLEHEEK